VISGSAVADALRLCDLATQLTSSRPSVERQSNRSLIASVKTDNKA